MIVKKILNEMCVGNMLFVRFKIADFPAGGSALRRTNMLQEIRKMKFEEVYQLRTEKKLSVQEAASILGVCERSFRRYVTQFKEDGLDGLNDARLAKAGHNASLSM